MGRKCEEEGRRGKTITVEVTAGTRRTVYRQGVDGGEAGEA